MQRPLYILVESDDDKRFFDRVIRPLLKGKYSEVRIFPHWIRWTDEQCRRWTSAFARLQADYILVTDIDSEPCVTAKKREVCRRFRSLDADRILVVVREIESWYYAGLDRRSCKKLKVAHAHSPDEITKEVLRSMKPEGFGSMRHFKREILNRFDMKRLGRPAPHSTTS